MRGSWIKHYKGVDLPYFIFSVRKGEKTE